MQDGGNCIIPLQKAAVEMRPYLLFDHLIDNNPETSNKRTYSCHQIQKVLKSDWSTEVRDIKCFQLGPGHFNQLEEQRAEHRQKTNKCSNRVVMCLSPSFIIGRYE